VKTAKIQYQYSQGFTLIEIMIVVFIIGLTVSLMSLSLGSSNEDNAAHKEAAAFMQAVDFIGEQTVLNGELVGMFVVQKDAEDGLAKQWCYRWQRFLDGKWQELTEDTLTEHCMVDDMEWDIILEGKRYEYDPNLEIQPPIVLLSPSGESTAAEMAIYEHGATIDAQRIEIDLVGNARWLNEEEKNKESRRDRK
jgi:general secretion pathway protein H